MKELSFNQLINRYKRTVSYWHKLRVGGYNGSEIVDYTPKEYGLLKIKRIETAEKRVLNMHKQITRHMQIDQLCNEAGVSLIRK